MYGSQGYLTTRLKPRYCSVFWGGTPLFQRLLPLTVLRHCCLLFQRQCCVGFYMYFGLLDFVDLTSEDYGASDNCFATLLDVLLSRSPRNG